MPGRKTKGMAEIPVIPNGFIDQVLWICNFPKNQMDSYRTIFLYLGTSAFIKLQAMIYARPQQQNTMK